MNRFRKHACARVRCRRAATHLLVLALLFPWQLPVASAAEGAQHRTPVADRWLEIDLYWFKQRDVDLSAREFWERFEPLYAGAHGDRGVILNIGWTVVPVMEWSGHLAQRISLPQGSGQSRWVEEHGPLRGTTLERQQQFAARFSAVVATQRRGYDPWTYGDLKSLVEALKREAGRHGVAAFKVGMLNYAWTNAYGETPTWVRRHPEAFTRPTADHPPDIFDVGPYFDPAMRFHRDPASLGGFPRGIPEGTPVHRAYAAQWGSLSKSIGLDAIMLRDSFGAPVPYYRGGPWGAVAPSSAIIHAASAAVAALVRETKLANPAALVMMYSNAASAISDWRSNGFDLEAIARQGYLDVWVDQTWAGAWNEVGIREGFFWNFPTKGWTYQLAYMLMHAAILAGTKVRHYPLIETFDAWEGWDVIHTAPERLRWGIWAYSHAAVKTPTGLRLPGGSYISWANQGERLLDTHDVHFLASEIDAAVDDARQTTEVFGPTLVYAREAMAWQVEHATPNHDVSEWLDEQAGSLVKWPVPILSATRLEWLPRVRSDLPILQTPSHLSGRSQAVLREFIGRGHPVAIFGSFADGIDTDLLGLAGLSHDGLATAGSSQRCSATNLTPGLVRNAPVTFETSCMPVRGVAAATARVIYAADGVPALTLPPDGATTVAAWDPPDLRSAEGISLAKDWGNTGAPYALAAGVLNTMLGKAGGVHASQIDLDQTVNVAAWQTRDGALHILAGNLEEGLRDDADLSRHATLVIPRAWRIASWTDAWTGQVLRPRDDELAIDLPQAASLLLRGAAAGVDTVVRQ